MKSRTFYSAIALLSGLLVLVGVVGFWGLTAQNPRSLMTKGGQEIPTAAQFVPRQAPVMASLLARPDRLWQLRQLLTPSNQRYAARQEWESLQQTLEEAVGWDYDTDLRPWLGEEITFAVTSTDLDYDETNGLQAGYLTVLSCRDAQAAREALHLLWQKRAATGRNLIFETISGISLIYDQEPVDSILKSVTTFGLNSSAPKSLASMMIGDRYVLLANDPQVLRQAITTYRASDVSLAKAANYRESIRNLPSQRIGWLYANVPQLLRWLGLESGDIIHPLSAEGQRANFLFTSFRAFPAGLLGDTAIAAPPGESFAAVRPAARSLPSALQLLPDDALFATAGTDVRDLISGINENFGGYHVTQRSLQALLNSLSLTTDALPSELFGPLQQDYALGAVSTPKPTWLLISQATSGSGLTSLDTFAQKQGINISHVPFKGQDITTWTRLSLTQTSPESSLALVTQVVGVHTRIRGYEVLSTSLAGLQQVLQSSNGEALPSQPVFAQLTERLEQPGGTLIYVNWPKLAPLLTQQLPWLKAIELAASPLTAHLGPIVLSGDGSSQSLQKSIIAIKLMENL